LSGPGTSKNNLVYNINYFMFADENLIYEEVNCCGYSLSDRDTALFTDDHPGEIER